MRHTVYGDALTQGQRFRIFECIRLSIYAKVRQFTTRLAQCLCQFSLIRDGFAVPFTSHAQAPTVTMPRVKALTTGSIPSFLDMVLNIAESDTTSTLAHQDTWIAQMAAKNDGALVMYGDDTWLKLFPDTFDRFDGTTSFFVSVGTFVWRNGSVLTTIRTSPRLITTLLAT